ncbi:MAG TPA: ABC transporter transmembrane domain-containing protein, partial [Gammaproteobacteria bacterium]|nr:ABC transporter transmembrane domain-containing protein [Gammaproteobacteria bacterium]
MMGDAETTGARAQELPPASADDPLLDCLVFLSKYHGRPLSRDALTAGLPIRERLDAPLFIRAAERAGLAARVQRRPLHRVSQLLLPAVLLLRDGSACVLLEIDRERARVRVMQPEAGEAEEELGLQDLEEQYTGYTVFVRPAFRFDRRTPEPESRRGHWFWGTLAQYSSIYRDVLVASLLINVFALATPLFIMNVYDRVVPNNAQETLWVLATGVVIVYLFDHILRGLRARYIDIAGRNADVSLSSRVFERALGLRMAARPSSVGVFANHLGEFENVRTFITSATITTLLDLPFILLFIGVIAIIGGVLALVPALLIPVVLAYGLWIQPRLREAVDNSMRGASQKNATLVESLVGVETIKTLGAEGEVQKKWEESVDYTSDWGARSRQLSASALNTAVLMQQLALVGVIVLGVYLISQGELTMGGLIAGVILTGRAMAPMGQVSNLATHFHQ